MIMQTHTSLHAPHMHSLQIQSLKRTAPECKQKGKRTLGAPKAVL